MVKSYFWFVIAEEYWTNLRSIHSHQSLWVAQGYKYWESWDMDLFIQHFNLWVSRKPPEGSICPASVFTFWKTQPAVIGIVIIANWFSKQASLFNNTNCVYVFIDNFSFNLNSWKHSPVGQEKSKFDKLGETMQDCGSAATVQLIAISSDFLYFSKHINAVVSN